MNDELDQPASSPEPAPETSDTGERAGRSRRRNRRGKSNRNRQEPQDDAIPQPEHANDARSSAPATPPQRPESRGQEPRRSRNQGFGDGIDHQICPFCVPRLPATYPVQGRQGIAVVPLHTVAEVDGVKLLCDQLHDGECLWPDLTPLDPIFAVSRNWTFVLQTGTEWIVLAEEREPQDDSGS